MGQRHTTKAAIIIGEDASARQARSLPARKLVRHEVVPHGIQPVLAVADTIEISRGLGVHLAFANVTLGFDIGSLNFARVSTS